MMSTQQSAEPTLRPKWPWFVIGGALVAALVAVIVVLVATFLVAVDAVDDIFDFEHLEELVEQSEERSITREQFDALQLGSTRAQVAAFLGVPPVDRAAFTGAGLDVSAGCEYYGVSGGWWQGGYELCYEQGLLAVKNETPILALPDEP